MPLPFDEAVESLGFPPILSARRPVGTKRPTDSAQATASRSRAPAHLGSAERIPASSHPAKTGVGSGERSRDVLLSTGCTRPPPLALTVENCFFFEFVFRLSGAWWETLACGAWWETLQQRMKTRQEKEAAAERSCFAAPSLSYVQPTLRSDLCFEIRAEW